MKGKAEYTDTFAGEANYGWLRTCEVEGGSLASIVRKVKAEFGLNGVRCRREEYENKVRLYPNGMARVVFIYLS